MSPDSGQTGALRAARKPVTGSSRSARGPLESIASTHWNLLYREPMRQYFSAIG
jgi:hypothetical protein